MNDVEESEDLDSRSPYGERQQSCTVHSLLKHEILNGNAQNSIAFAAIIPQKYNTVNLNAVRTDNKNYVCLWFAQEFVMPQRKSSFVFQMSFSYMY